MKKLVLSAFVLGGLSTGCIIDGGDPDPTTGDIQVSWALRSSDSNGQVIAAACPPNATELAIYSQPSVGEPYVDKYACGDAVGAATNLPPDNYLVWVRLSAGATLLAESAAYPVTVFANNVSPVGIDLFTDRAFFQASWRLSTAGGAATTCAAAGATNMSILATVSGGADAFDDDNGTCAAGEGSIVLTDTPVPSATAYTVVLSPLNSLGEALGVSSALTDQTLTYGNQYLDLGDVPITLD